RRPPTARWVETAHHPSYGQRLGVLAVHRRRGGLKHFGRVRNEIGRYRVLAVHRRRGGLKPAPAPVPHHPQPGPRRPPTARWVETAKGSIDGPSGSGESSPSTDGEVG